jgi:hypothetical protein
VSILPFLLFALIAPAQAAPNWCAKLRYEAIKLRPELPPSLNNFVNCGVGGGQPSNYAFATDPHATVEMHIVSVAQGSFSARRRGQGDERAVEVFVYATEHPALIILNSAEPTDWEVTMTKNANIDRIVTQGPRPQRIRGLPPEVPILHREEQRVCRPAYGWETRINRGSSAYKEFITSIRCGMGLRETSFQGCREGAVFEIPFYRRGKSVRMPFDNEAACPIAIAPEEISPLARPLSALSRKAKSPATLPPIKKRTVEPRYSTEPRRRTLPRKKTSTPIAPNIPGRGAEKMPSLLGRKSPKAQRLPRPAPPTPRGDVPVRALSILEDGNLGLLTADAVPDIIIALRKGNASLRARAAEALGNVRPKAVQAVKPLAKALKDESPRVAANAALALGKIGPEAAPALKRLKKALRHKHPDVRLAAETALKHIGTPKALKILQRYRQ